MNSTSISIYRWGSVEVLDAVSSFVCVELSFLLLLGYGFDNYIDRFYGLDNYVDPFGTIHFGNRSKYMFLPG